MFYLNEKPDSGDLIGQNNISIAMDDYIGDVLRKIDSAMVNMVAKYLPLLEKDEAPREPQPIGAGNYTRLRTNSDSVIKWTKNADEIYNLVRAISHPYPGAHFFIKNKPVKVWRARLVDCEKPHCLADLANVQEGMIIERSPRNWYLIKCRNGLIEIKVEETLKQGMNLSS